MPRIAILDMNNGTPNLGLPSIIHTVTAYDSSLEYQVFDVRQKQELPDLGFDVYISSGGPGSPLRGDGIWDKAWNNWLDSLLDWNREHFPKKHVLLICHSFQMAVHHWRLARVTKRRKMSFGIFPVHKTVEGMEERLFSQLPDPFYVADFRRYQVIQPRMERLEAMGASILALEKIRPHIDLERAVMGIRFSDELIGLQFHPEADAPGMLEHFKKPHKKKQVVDEYGLEKYEGMIEHLNDEDKIALTHSQIIPAFLSNALAAAHAEV